MNREQGEGLVLGTGPGGLPGIEVGLGVAALRVLAFSNPDFLL